MNKKHARLAAAVNEAMQAQGFTMKKIATAAGMPLSSLNNALSGKYDMREERWRMVCENLGLCYEDVIADPVEEQARAEGTTEGDPVPMRAESIEEQTFSEDERRLLDVILRYLAGHLKEDIRKGMDIALEDLYLLLDACKRMQSVVEAGSSDD